MHHQEFAPPAALRDAVRCFWYNRREGGAGPSSFDVMPDGYAEIVFCFGACKVSYAGSWCDLPSPFMVGLLDQPFTVAAGAQLEILGIRCFPWAVFALLGLTPADAGGVPIMPVAHPLADLQPRLAAHVEAGRIDAALAELERALLDALPRPAIDGTAARAGMALRASQGKLPVSQAAAAAHATVRTLERKFKQSSGHTVKDVAALIRFEQARNRLWHESKPDLAALAQELGYADQSHLSREFKRYSGMTPAAFARHRQLGK
ncbi:AraC family transcriptional regulator, partial [Massilia sp. 9096]|uniref:AraC family transcriptional regulator n=1 Tax=Massilia sp. 9096 TaxID=1500894 RepID=UPI00056C4A85